MYDSSLVHTPAYVAIRHDGADSTRFAALEVGAAAVEKGLDALARREKLDAAKERQRRHLPRSAEPAEWLLEVDGYFVGCRVAEVDHRYVKKPVVEFKIDNHLGVIATGSDLRSIARARWLVGAFL
ncbi:MAG: hypothetical protein ABI877_12580 [Gemmatimonadaceae bacterium]